MTILTSSNLSRLNTAGLALFCILVLPVLAVVMIGQALLGSKLRALKMAIAIDQCGNAALGGSEDETISSRSWAAYQAGRPWGRYAVRFIDALFGENHCRDSAGI